jgi:MoaA/NifB/PqqE/SkfB family radical SAM enzyme
MHAIPDEDPGDPRVFVPNVEFYITNVCNLTCTDCNRFNNHNFRGWQNWNDYAEQYQQWAKYIKLQRITILGGEPLLNPTICDWIDGINQLWGKTVQVLTNGTRLNHVPDLYDRMIKFNDPVLVCKKNWIGVSLHNENDRQRCFDEIQKFLKGTITYYAKDHPDNVDNSATYGADHAFIDSNGMRVHVWEYNSFYKSAIQRNAQGRLNLWNNDPEEVHRYCGFVQYKCYHFIKAKLYKCGPVALFPEFDQQHTLNISDQDRDLINSYLPLSVDQFEQRGQEFLDHIDDMIPQCKFCPTDKQLSGKKLFAVSKKINSVSGFD